VKIAVLGDVLVDVLAKTDHPLAVASDTPARISMSPGGSASGTAAWLAHDKRPAILLGAVGDDGLAELALRSLSGVDLRVQRVPGRTTGCCVVIVDGSGERSMLPDAGANLDWTWRPRDLEGATHLHVSAYPAYRDETHTFVVAAMSDARERGLTVSVDLASSAPIHSQRERAWGIIEFADLVFANLDEARALLGHDDDLALLEALLARTGTVVIKLGSRGCIAGTADQVVGLPAIVTDVVDTTGAGDAFSAGFLPRWLEGASLAECVEAGQLSAVRTLGRVGAGPPVGNPPQ
jgi:sugar/nucleoside kinase (ribokinase family)